MAFFPLSFDNDVTTEQQAELARGILLHPGKEQVQTPLQPLLFDLWASIKAAGGPSDASPSSAPKPPPLPPRGPSDEELLASAPDAQIDDGVYRLVGKELLFVRDGQVKNKVRVDEWEVQFEETNLPWVGVVLTLLTLGSGAVGCLGTIVLGSDVFFKPPGVCLGLTPAFLIATIAAFYLYSKAPPKNRLALSRGSRKKFWKVSSRVTMDEGKALQEAIEAAKQGRATQEQDKGVPDWATNAAPKASGPAASSPRAAGASHVDDVMLTQHWLLLAEQPASDPPEGLILSEATSGEAFITARVTLLAALDTCKDHPLLRPDVFGLGLFAGSFTRALHVDSDRVDEIADWVADAPAVLLSPGPSIRDAKNRLILDLSGSAAPHPDARSPTNPDTIRRRRRTVARLTEEGYPLIGLPPYEERLTLRPASEVARRALALGFVVGPLACPVLDGQPIPETLPPFLQPMMPFLTASEQQFLASPAVEQAAQLQWRIESALTLYWAIGWVETLPPVTATADGSEGVTLLERARTDLDALIASANLRDEDELRDVIDDLHCRYWATVDARVNGRPDPTQHHAGVVYERLFALCWLSGYTQEEPIDWDSFVIPT